MPACQASLPLGGAPTAAVRAAPTDSLTTPLRHTTDPSASAPHRRQRRAMRLARQWEAGGDQEGGGLLRSVSDLADTLGHWSAVLGMFAQVGPRAGGRAVS